MKSLTKCPVCSDSLLNTSMRLKSGNNIWLKTCVNRLGHNVSCSTKVNNDDELSTLSFVIDSKSQLRVTWFFDDKLVFIHKSSVNLAKKNGQMIPYFEPDLSNYKKMLEKIKTYLIFS